MVLLLLCFSASAQENQGPDHEEKTLEEPDAESEPGLEAEDEEGEDQIGLEEGQDSKDDPFAGEDEDPFSGEQDSEDNPFSGEGDDPFASEEDSLAGEAVGESAELEGDRAWKSFLDAKALVLVNLMVRSRNAKKAEVRKSLEDRAQKLVEDIEVEALKRFESGNLSEEAYSEWNDQFQKRIERETAAVLATSNPRLYISLFESEWFSEGYNERLVLFYRLALDQRNSQEASGPSPRFLAQAEFYDEVLEAATQKEMLSEIRSRAESILEGMEDEAVESPDTALNRKDLVLAISVLEDLELKLPAQEEEEEPETEGLVIGDETETPEEESGVLDELGEMVEEQTEVPFDAQVGFTHEINTLFGMSEIRGLYLVDPNISSINEFRLGTTYSPQFRIQVSPNTYNFFRMSVTFTQSYESNQERWFDGLFTLREIYTNYRKGKHQVRYGTQIFKLGKVDFDNTIDTLHLNNFMRFYTTFDPDKKKDALFALKYNWFGGDHTFTGYLAPIRQESFGMRFVGFRESLEDQQSGKKRESSSIFRDYFGLQYQWTGENVDARVGFFRWFDVDPTTSFIYDRSSGSSGFQSAFENLLSNYHEAEANTSFYTLELDAIWSGMAWKLDAGYYTRKNVYTYSIEDRNKLKFNTVNAPFTAWATSIERTFPYFYWLMMYSQRDFSPLPAGSHVLFFENEPNLVNTVRDLGRDQLTGIAVVKTPDNNIRVAMVHFQTWPFIQRGWVSLWTWDRPEDNYQLEFKFYSLKTDYQKMLDSVLDTTQAYFVYTQRFSGF